ncbi:hypothetical protein PPERSA_07036 [Pseudocohnilembus persalinus]|uniref:Uncharacterized protein n=1 Tax=Pseudocohnilembus persalinus TaxID=266149 RepID=A0A0V0QMC5_PSEPJ|nr:hypothetical protein PPERSA_07036 [Pseudocohnilembus persalinus]|eukprot:KRX03208.1 hypothetical protein PPERSA_07036 [Pseudocohnilembus persalinus]
MYIKIREIKDQDYPRQVIDEKTAKSYCGQVVYNKDLGLKKLVSVNGEQLDPDDIAVPCGQIAKSYFNDSFKLYYKEKNQEGEKGDKFRNQDLSKQWADIENEHFINWVRTASFSNFEKLWGKIEGSLKKEQGTFKLVVENNYDTDYFGGGKSIVLRNSSFLGGQQYIAVYLLLGLGLGLAGFGGYFLKNYREFQSAEKRINQVQQQFCED